MTTSIRWAAATLMLLSACGTPNPGIDTSVEKARKLQPDDSPQLTEPQKIRALIDAVRTSELTFIQDGQRRKGPEAADDLERRMARNAAGIPTARRFIERVGVGKLKASAPDTVMLPGDDGGDNEVSMRVWLMARLAELESEELEDMGKVEAAKQVKQEAFRQTDVGILDVLVMVEQSGLRFVAPPRRDPKGQPRGKRKEYTASEFAGMLRKKWEFLGRDITDLDTFIEVIASDSFSSMEPYLVILRDGQEVEFRTWLLKRIEAKKVERQQVAAAAQAG